MKSNKLVIKINQPKEKVFEFTTTPPNSSLWIPGVVKEETTKWPVKIGTVYKLTDDLGNISIVIVNQIKKNELIEWISEDKNYHCKYILKEVTDKKSILEYYEWVDEGEIENPFNQEILNQLKFILEK